MTRATLASNLGGTSARCVVWTLLGIATYLGRCKRSEQQVCRREAHETYRWGTGVSRLPTAGGNASAAAQTRPRWVCSFFQTPRRRGRRTRRASWLCKWLGTARDSYAAYKKLADPRATRAEERDGSRRELNVWQRECCGQKRGMRGQRTGAGTVRISTARDRYSLGLLASPVWKPGAARGQPAGTVGRLWTTSLSSARKESENQGGTCRKLDRWCMQVGGGPEARPVGRSATGQAQHPTQDPGGANTFRTLPRLRTHRRSCGNELFSPRHQPQTSVLGGGLFPAPCPSWQTMAKEGPRGKCLQRDIAARGADKLKISVPYTVYSRYFVWTKFTPHTEYGVLRMW